MVGKIRNTILNSQRGFTLIELLAVMAIVGVLAGIVTTAVSGTGAESRLAQVAQDAGTVFTASTEYFTDQEGVATARTDDQNVLGAVTAQAITSAWPEDSFGSLDSSSVAHAYPEEFPLTDSEDLRAQSVVFLDFDGVNTPVVIDTRSATFGADLNINSVANFLAGYSAIDFTTLVVGGYMDAAPESFDSKFDDKFNNYLWVFEKAATPTSEASDTRDVVVYQLVSADPTDLASSTVYDLIYLRIQ